MSARIQALLLVLATNRGCSLQRRDPLGAVKARLVGQGRPAAGAPALSTLGNTVRRAGLSAVASVAIVGT